ncbi:MAG: glutaredoxin [Psychroserpens sp.]|jgi:glutaredoxin
MRLTLVSIFYLMLPLACFSQISSNPYVTLVEKKSGKRLQLFAKNTDSIPYAVFLRVTTKDYRRTSKRPVLKEIPGNSTLLLKTLIVLDGKEGRYDTTFIVNEVTTSLTMRKTHDQFNLKINAAKLEKTILMYSNSNCELCNQAIEILEDNAFNFENYNLETNIEVSESLKSELDISSLQDLKFPILKIEDQIYTNVDSRKKFIEILKVYFE